MTAREEIVAALAAMQARVDAATPMEVVSQLGRHLNPPDAELVRLVLVREQRVIDHTTRVLARHSGRHTCPTDDDDAVRFGPDLDCPDIASVHAMVVGP